MKKLLILLICLFVSFEVRSDDDLSGKQLLCEFENIHKIKHLQGFRFLDSKKVTLYDGSFHDVDSSEMAFKIAGSLAFKDAVKKAGAVVLEPVMKVEVVVPEDFMGTVIGDLNSRRGRIQGTESRGELQGVQTEVPLSEMFGYATDVRSLTEGRATFTMEFSTYSDVPQHIYEKMKLEEA